MSRNIFSILSFTLLTAIVTIPAMAGNIKGKVHLKGAKQSTGVLVYLEHVEGKFAPPKKPAQMNQSNLAFSPMVLPILVGTTVNFLNSDSVLHNVFTPSNCGGNFNLGTWPKGEIRSHTFTKSGCIDTILCDVHPDMQAWIVVLQNPYFTQTNQDGEFEIRNIPPGTYVLRIWYPFYNTISENVKIKDTKVLIQDFTLKRTY